MKKVINLSLTRLYVNELGTLGRNVLQVASASAANNIIPQIILSNISDVLVLYDGAVGKITASEATLLSGQLDDERDELIWALKGLVMATRYRTNEAIKSAGRKLEDAIRHRGWHMQSDSYAAETNEINQLLGDIKSSDELQSAITLLNATEVVEQLGITNRRFEENEQSRIAGKVAKGNVSSTEAIDQLRKSILTLFNYLNSVSGVYPEAAMAINSINGVLEPFATQLKARATSAVNNKLAAEANQAQN